MTEPARSSARPPANAERGKQASGPPSEAARLLTAEQVAARWQVPKSQVYRLAREGRVPVVRLGRYMRFRSRRSPSGSLEGVTRMSKPLLRAVRAPSPCAFAAPAAWSESPAVSP